MRGNPRYVAVSKENQINVFVLETFGGLLCFDVRVPHFWPGSLGVLDQRCLEGFRFNCE